MSNWLSSLNKVAANLLNPSTLGATCEITVNKSIGYDPVSRRDRVVSETAVLDCSVPLAYKLSDIDGTNIRQSDVLILLSGESWAGLGDIFGTEPNTEMSIAIDGNSYSIVSVQSVKGDGVVLFKMQCRGL